MYAKHAGGTVEQAVENWVWNSLQSPELKI